MQLAYDLNAPRKTVNLTVNSELLRMMRKINAIFLPLWTMQWWNT